MKRTGTSAEAPFLRGQYRVSIKPETRGDLLAVERLPDAPAAPGWKGRKCWEVFGVRNGPCPGCPIFDAPPGREVSGVLRKESGPHLIVHAVIGKRASDVRMLSVPDRTLVEVTHEKLRRQAATFELSDKEREVLELLLLGRQTREIATALGISVRTVKYHVTNLLEKVGADSRLDITRRLLLTAEGAGCGARGAKRG